tara:strand:+ start:291 stop:956 length:666 start_codon:yes stop_codon:yes gene_type:complete
MEVVSVNISKPIEVEYLGKTITTGIFKKPVEGPINIRNNNLVGDGQADLKNHGGADKAVYVFSADHYPYWSKALNSANLVPGVFGENLTISGLSEAAMHIGDQLSIGSCLLEVSQPRVPCFKLGIALNSNIMPKLFTQHFETGVYLRVLEEGAIEAGNEVSVIKRDPAQISVKTLFQAYFDKTFEDSNEIFAQALLIPALADEWRNHLSNRLAKNIKHYEH